MDLPKVITTLIKAQGNFDSLDYSNCFAHTAKVYDEGYAHIGRTEIKDWIEEANNKYKTIIKPLQYDGNVDQAVLTAEISGTFPGSPILLKYYFEFEDGLIRSLRITS